MTESERKRPKVCCKRSHDNWAEAQHACLKDRISCTLSFLALSLQRKVDHHDGILLDDADKKEDAYERDDIELAMKEDERADSADAGRWKSGENGNGVDEALIQDPKNDVDGKQSGDDE